MSSITKFSGGYYAFKTGKPRGRHWVLRDGDHRTVAYFKRLRDVQAKVVDLQRPLCERLREPASVEEAGRLLASVS